MTDLIKRQCARRQSCPAHITQPEKSEQAGAVQSAASQPALAAAIRFIPWTASEADCL